MSSTTSQTLLIFNYKSNDYMHIPFRPGDTCEDVCISCCKALGILPPTRLLFGLRVQGTAKWKVLCMLRLDVSVNYEFRMRFKVPDFNSLHKIDPDAYDYLYYQIRHDLVSDRISDIRYPAYKDNVVGLGAVDMYIDLLENKASAGSIESNYKHYLPKQLVKSHWIFAKKSICETFQRIRKNNRELSYVKRRYMHTIMELSPNYQMEIYNAIVEKLPDEDENNGPYLVTVKLDPFDADGPAIKVSQKIKEDWLVLTKLENIYALYRERKKVVHLDISGLPRGYRLEFSKPFEVKSFMTYIAGYFRLMTKWMFDPCVQYETPSLQELKTLRCHGPVGGDFSYAKIRDKEGKCGSYILRQCEREYDIYYIDINTKGTQTETFKITRDRDKWELHINDDVCSFNKLTDLALGIPTASEKKFRIPPSEYDKPPLLLICLPRNLLPKKTVSVVNEAQLQRKRAQIFDPKEDLQWYKNSQKDCDDDKMVSLRADWVQSNNVKDVRVTLKHLKYDEDFQDFMKLTNTWNTIYSPEFIKIYGITLTTPYTMVMENAKYGPLNEFLYTLGDKVPLECLLDAVHGLVRGIAYLQEKGLIHGFIRCSYLMVTKFDPKKQLLIAKISDYGLPRPYKLQDLPWIPFDYHKDLEAAKTDPQAELWAFATTFWEVFARGKPINNVSAETLSQNYYRYGYILPMPPLCPEDLHPVMMDGWSMDPDKRFNQQAILKLLNLSKQNLHPNYTTIDKTDSISDDGGSIISDFSNATDDTFQTLLNGNSSSDQGSCAISGNSFTCDRAPLIRHNGIRKHHTNYFDDIPSVLMIPNGKIIYKEKIGEGHYGTVYRGEIQYHNNYVPVPVAIKTLKLSKSNKRFSEDFMREIKIMQELNHPNIIKIKMSVESPVSIIMEYVESRSFIVYLSSQKPNLTNETLLCFALDIAKGMEYLRSKKVIHRDLAARNILVDGSTVKISDFGLAQIANNDGYYFAQSEREIPIKWYAPESIKTTKFSFQSDVWSYGVTLFEMFSRGEIPNLDPNKELSQVDFLNRLESGHRLRRPELCPESVYDKVMIPCWHENPKMRPVFKDIVDIIQSIKNESGECI